MLYVVNSFSANMLQRVQSRVVFTPLDLHSAKALVTEYFWELEGAVGHADTAEVIGRMVGIARHRVFGRKTVQFKNGDGLLIAQYAGPHLPEGATSLPEGATIEWWLATIGAA